MTMISRFWNRLTRDWNEPQTIRVPYNPRTQAGVIITDDTALTVAAVWACIRYLSQTVAGLPWEVYRPDPRGATKAPRHPVNWIISKRACPDYSSFQFRETLMNWALRWGNGYAEITRDAGGRVTGLYPLHPERVTVRRDRITDEIYYDVDGGGGSSSSGHRLEAHQVFHLRGFGDAGPVGLNVMQYAAESIGQAKAAQLFGAAFFGSGANPSGIVTMKKPLTEDGLKELESRFRSLFKGPKNSNKTMFIDNEMEYKTISSTPEQSQFNETSMYMVEEICRWFGVPPHKVQHLLRATFSNIEHQSIEVVTDTVGPWVQRFEDEANYKLLGQTRDGFYTDFNMTSLLRGDTAARLAYYRGLREIGVFSANDILERENLPLLSAGEGGDKRVMQGQYTTLERIGEDPVVQAPAAPAQVEPENPDDDEAEEQEEETVKPDPEALRRITILEEMVIALNSTVNAQTELLTQIGNSQTELVKALKVNEVATAEGARATVALAEALASVQDQHSKTVGMMTDVVSAVEAVGGNVDKLSASVAALPVSFDMTKAGEIVTTNANGSISILGAVPVPVVPTLDRLQIDDYNRVTAEFSDGRTEDVGVINVRTGKRRAKVNGATHVGA